MLALFTSPVQAQTVLDDSLLTYAYDISTDSFHLSFNSTIGFNYTVEFSTDLVNWSTLVTKTGTGGVLEIFDPITNDQGFYRVTVTATAATNTGYIYDDLNQLKTINEGGKTTTYQHDEVGNIINKTIF